MGIGMKYSKRFLMDLYKKMLRIRESEEALVEPIVMGEVRCPAHLYSGEEAVAVGVIAALEERDVIFGTHRSHGHYLAKGGNLNAMMAEIFCRETGCARGRGGSMHLIAPGCGMLGAAPIVAGTISLAVGAALAAKVRGDGSIAVSFFGDGAMGEGVLYEAMNVAVLWRLPVVFVCENNLYSTHLRIDECRANTNLYESALAFGTWARQVDGNDVLAIYEGARQAVELTRAGDGPGFLECMTYRLRGHVGPDDNIQGTHTDIRPAEELDGWRSRDPLPLLEKVMEASGVMEEEIAGIRQAVEKDVEVALRFARDSSFPDGKEVGRHVFG